MSQSLGASAVDVIINAIKPTRGVIGSEAVERSRRLIRHPMTQHCWIGATSAFLSSSFFVPELAVTNK